MPAYEFHSYVFSIFLIIKINYSVFGNKDVILACENG